VRDVADETLVDLEHIDGKALEVGQRRVTGAEVIDRQAHAQLAQLAQHGQGFVRPLGQRAFGDLQLQRLGAVARACRARAVQPATSVSRNWCGDTFTATDTSGRPCMRQACAWRQASWITHSPSGPIRPELSATGMKRAGEMKPSCGSFQRSRASAPTMRPLAMSTCGW
jgi:hypothetical protein